MQFLIKQSDAEAETSFMQKTNTHKYWPVMLSAALILVSITYVGCYLLPYMFLAFIHDPLLTILNFTYLMVALFTICIYLICQGAWHILKI